MPKGGGGILQAPLSEGRYPHERFLLTRKVLLKSMKAITTHMNAALSHWIFHALSTSHNTYQFISS